ncbi:MAG: hypothetical protein M3328_15225 [Chloroflexota bacterium]|nr:hypothetical protein [Chloroflexota bacterium]
MFCATVAVSGFQLFVLGAYTDRFFAWTIEVPLTAAFLGAAYWGSLPLVLISSRQHLWAQARVAVPSVLVFTALTLVATLIHIDLFHLDSVFGWVWLVVYVIVPPAMVLFLVNQLRVAGGDPPRRAPLPAWMRLTLGTQAAIMLALGMALFVAPLTTAKLWPWALTPLTGRAVGAWLVGIGIAAAHMCRENDYQRAYAGLGGYATLGALQLLAVVRYAESVNWSGAAGWLYTGFVLSVLVSGVYGWFEARSRVGPRATG